MQLVAINVLLYAVNRDSAGHVAAKAWLERALGGDEPLALPWVVLVASLRIAGRGRVLARPLSPG